MWVGNLDQSVFTRRVVAFSLGFCVISWAVKVCLTDLWNSVVSVGDTRYRGGTIGSWFPDVAEESYV